MSVRWQVERSESSWINVGANFCMLFHGHGLEIPAELKEELVWPEVVSTPQTPQKWCLGIHRWLEAFNRGKPARDWVLGSAVAGFLSPKTGHFYVAGTGVFGVWILRRGEWINGMRPDVDALVSPTGDSHLFPSSVLGYGDAGEQIRFTRWKVENDDLIAVACYDQHNHQNEWVELVVESSEEMIVL